LLASIKSVGVLVTVVQGLILIPDIILSECRLHGLYLEVKSLAEET
jgi:hypothetical protein